MKKLINSTLLIFVLITGFNAFAGESIVINMSNKTSAEQVIPVPFQDETEVTIILPRNIKKGDYLNITTMPLGGIYCFGKYEDSFGLHNKDAKSWQKSHDPMDRWQNRGTGIVVNGEGKPRWTLRRGTKNDGLTDNITLSGDEQTLYMTFSCAKNAKTAFNMKIDITKEEQNPLLNLLASYLQSKNVKQQMQQQSHNNNSNQQIQDDMKENYVDNSVDSNVNTTPKIDDVD